MATNRLNGKRVFASLFYSVFVRVSATVSATSTTPIAAVIACILLGPLMGVGGAGLAQSGDPDGTELHFPRFVSASVENTSGVAIFNPNFSPAIADLFLVDTAGNLVADVFPNPLTLTVPGRGQIARTASDLYSFPTFDASLLIISATPGLVAYYQTFDQQGTFMDGAEPPRAGMEIIFPVVPGFEQGVSEINVLNPSPRSTGVELSLWGLDGQRRAQSNISVQAYGNYRSLAHDAFPGVEDFTGISHITAKGKSANLFAQAQQISGTSLFLGFSSLAPPGGFVDLAALNAVSLTELSNGGVLPYFRTGATDTSFVSVANSDSSSGDVTVTFIGNDGANLGASQFSVPANGGYRASIESSLGAPANGSDVEGWILVQASGRIAAAVIYGNREAASLAALLMQPAPQFAFLFSQAVQSAGMFTEISLANPNPQDAYVTVYVVDPLAVTQAIGQVIVGPNRRVSKTLIEFLPEVSSLSGGYVYLNSTLPLFATATLGTSSGMTLANFSPSRVSESFVPASLETFAVTGTIFVNGKPAEGFQIALSGPTASTTSSRADGTYAFSGLASGRYSMAVDQFGFQFAPSEVNFDIRFASRRQDFQGFTSDDAIVVAPASIAVNSADTKVSVHGRDFNQSSEVFLGTIRLATTFIDSNQLEATVPGFALSSPVQFDVRVVTNPNGPDRRVSGSYAVVVFSDRPLLSGVITPGDIVQGSAGATLTIRGIGFLQGARVKINGSSDGINVTLVDDSQLTVSVPAIYFVEGGIFPVTVENPWPANVESNIQLLTVFYPAPGIEQISPASVPAKLEPGAGPLSVDVFGYGFRRGAVVLFNGQPVPTTYCEVDSFCLTVHLTAQIPADSLRQSGFGQISVRNPNPSLAASEVANLLIQGLQPTITSVLPGSATLLDNPSLYSMPIIINGTNLGSQTGVKVYESGTPPPTGFTRAGVSDISSTQLVVSLTVEFPDDIGEWIVEISNPQPGGGRSQPVSFFITQGSFVANPFLVSLSPQTVAAAGPAFTLIVNGTNFKGGAQINFNTAALATSFISDRQLRAEVPASMIQSVGRIPISVTNPDNGGTSNRIFLDIR